MDPHFRHGLWPLAQPGTLPLARTHLRSALVGLALEEQVTFRAGARSWNARCFAPRMRRARPQLTLALACVVLTGAQLACSRTKKLDEEKTSTTTLTSSSEIEAASGLKAAAFVSNHEAVAHLMEASCTREAECLTPGLSPDESTHEKCFRRVGRNLQNRLGAESCPLGIGGVPLERCLKGLQRQGCGSSIDAVDQLSLCQTSELCRVPSTPSDPPLTPDPK